MASSVSMNRLREFLDQSRATGLRPKPGQAPVEEANIACGSVAIRGKRLGVCDLSRIPSGVSVECQPGEYHMEAHCYSYGGDARVARMTVRLPRSSPSLGPSMGEVDVDFGMACLFDADILEVFADTKSDDYQQWVDDSVMFSDWQSAGVLVCEPAGVEIPYMETGFGDGSYRVHILEEGGKFVGVRIIFLEENAPYPFGDATAEASAAPSDHKSEMVPLGRDLGEQIVPVYRLALPDPECPIALEFEFRFPSRTVKEKVASDLRRAGLQPSQGFGGKDEIVDDGEDLDGDGQWTCIARSVERVDIESLNALGARLDRLAERHGGSFEMWNHAVGMSDGEPSWTAQERALKLCASGRFEEAIPVLRELVTLAVPVGEGSWRILGMALANSGQNAEALAIFQRALRVDPSDHDSSAGLGVVLMKLGRMREAAAAFRKAISGEPTHSTANFNIACLYSEQGEPAAALRHLTVAVKTNPKLKNVARDEPSFAGLRDNPEFRSLLRD